MASGGKTGRTTPKRSREQRLAVMEKDILDVEGAAALLGVSTRTISNVPRRGAIPATRVGRAWRCARRNLITWVANDSQADQLAAALCHGRVAQRRR